jgi:lysophospholipase L1-like esterase
MVTPLRILLLLFYIGCITTVLMVITPKEIAFFDNVKLKMFTFEDLDSKENTIKNVDLSELNEYAKQVDSVEKEVNNTPPPLVTSSVNDGEIIVTREKIEPVKQVKFPIQFPDSTQPHHLDNFFASLVNIYNDKSLVRIVHYGDSQIEGDRISEYLRTRFQGRFGGCGVGLVPMVEKLSFRSTMTTDFAPNWSRLAIYGNDAPKKRRKGVRYGLLAASYRYAPVGNDSTISSDKIYKSWVKFRETSYNADPKSTQIENIKILYSSPTRINTDFKVNSSGSKGDSSFSQSLGYASDFNVFEQSVSTRFKSLTIHFESEAGAEMYGVALDCKAGIAVDNVALRGSSGVEFTKIDAAMLKQQIKEMNVKLFIMQFGVNVVPNVLSDYTFYENLFYQQLRFIKSIAPEVSILVVGVSDMARKRGAGYSSYPNVPIIREAQKRAAFKAGCAYWDLYEAMGGQNSMISWVNNKPALANKDYTHFTARGARVVGEMLYNAIIKEYEGFKRRKGYDKEEMQ